jgi:hypothetical protein
MIFHVGEAIRYKPTPGTYQDVLEADGRLPGVVVGQTDTRVRVRLTLHKRYGAEVTRAVDAASLMREPEA